MAAEGRPSPQRVECGAVARCANGCAHTPWIPRGSAPHAECVSPTRPKRSANIFCGGSGVSPCHAATAAAAADGHCLKVRYGCRASSIPHPLASRRTNVLSRPKWLCFSSGDAIHKPAHKIGQRLRTAGARFDARYALRLSRREADASALTDAWWRWHALMQMTRRLKFLGQLSPVAARVAAEFIASDLRRLGGRRNFAAGTSAR